MSTAREMFQEFVRIVADALDEPQLDGAALAARMHLSRFHLDRILSAAAGEPPARFRRRILLERAAYRLASTGDDVLTVAIEAGYSSNEASTRAFGRAFAAPPSTWRRAPGPIHLHAANGVHFHPPGGLRLPARTKVTSSRPYDFAQEDHEDLDSIASRLAEHGHAFLTQHRAIVAEGRIEDTFVDVTGKRPYVFTYGAMLAHVLTYAAHRRTLVVGALASAGADLDDDPLVWPPLSP